jgi:uncharacterized protein YegP (UPF0339 family)
MASSSLLAPNIRKSGTLAAQHTKRKVGREHRLRSSVMAQRPFPSYWIYRDNQRQWCWRYDARNGETIAVSSEAYVRKADCQRGIEIMQESASSPVWGSQADIDVR